MAGAVMLVTPGPGILTIAAGLSILSKDVPAAARMKDRVGARVDAARQSLNGKGGSSDTRGRLHPTVPKKVN